MTHADDNDDIVMSTHLGMAESWIDRATDIVDGDATADQCLAFAQAHALVTIADALRLMSIVDAS